uniref:Uncharacterized protein n=1 Tax=Rhizophora mucronata TaxID=61149 RepID=A0A2P2P5K3_RHIMU
MLEVVTDIAILNISANNATTISGKSLSKYPEINEFQVTTFFSGIS